MVAGTAVWDRPDCMNWSIAIWAVASCMATRSGRRTSMAFPLDHSWLSKSSAWVARIFSAKVSGRPKRARARDTSSHIRP